MTRDVINVASTPDAEVGRALLATPWAIAVEVAHERISYGAFLEADPFMLKFIKQAVFEATRDAIVKNSA